jgi:hypothetical protein
MKAGIFAVAAAMAAGVSAKGHHHNHEAFHAERGLKNETCVAGCTTIYTTIYGEATRTLNTCSPDMSNPKITAFSL